MKKDRLAPYILVSCLIHVSVLMGAHRFLELPAEELEVAELIPVEMVVIREESPASQPEFAPGDRIWPKKALQTKSREIMKTMTDRSADDITTPIPEAGVFEPSVTTAGMATTVFFAEVPAARRPRPSDPARVATAPRNHHRFDWSLESGDQGVRHRVEEEGYIEIVTMFLDRIGPVLRCLAFAEAHLIGHHHPAIAG